MIVAELKAFVALRSGARATAGAEGAGAAGRDRVGHLGHDVQRRRRLERRAWRPRRAEGSRGLDEGGAVILHGHSLFL